jgi:dTDP-4-dehydrorhamnose reductase
MKKKLLILGISGLTGYKIATNANNYDVYGTYNSRPISLDNCIVSKLDITNKAQLLQILSTTKPDVIINTTALHNVDFCEDNPNISYQVNTEAVESISKYCQHNDIRFIHVSTDYVYDGNSTKPYVETDDTHPLNTYGKSKLDGEKSLSENQVVIRPSVVYGWTPLEIAGATSSSGKPMNFALWILTKLQKNEHLKIVTDQFATATLADSLASSILKIANSDKSGLYHVSGLSCESRYEFTIKLAKRFGYDPSMITPTTSSEFKQKAKRPSYSCLDCTKSIKEFNLNLYTTDMALDVMRSQVEKEAPHFIL